MSVKDHQIFLIVEKICKISLLRPDRAYKDYFFFCLFCLLSYIFKTFELSFEGLYHLDGPSLFEAYIRPPL